MGTQMMVKWDNHPITLLSELQQLLFDGAFTDVTLVCEDNSFKTHKVLLVTLSSFFQNLFKGDFQNCCTVNMNNIKSIYLKEIIKLLYHGEAHLNENQLPEFFKIAGLLQVKGFIESSEYNISINKKLLNNKTVDVEFIEDTTIHLHLNSSSKSDDKDKQCTSSEINEDEHFIDPSSIVKQEFVEGNASIFPDHTAKEELHKNSKESSVFNNLISNQETVCNSQEKVGELRKDNQCKPPRTYPNNNTIKFEVDSSTRSQGQNHKNQLLSNIKTKQLDSESLLHYLISDGTLSRRSLSQDSIPFNDISRKPTQKRRKIADTNFKVIGVGISSRTRNRQNDPETVPSNNEIEDEGSEEEHPLNNENGINQSKPTCPSQQKEIGLEFTKWFDKVKNYDKQTLTNEFATSLSFHGDSIKRVNKNVENKSCPVHSSHQNLKPQHQTIDYPEKDIYSCSFCKMTFKQRLNYLMHLNIHYKNDISSQFSCICRKTAVNRTMNSTEGSDINVHSSQEAHLPRLSKKNRKRFLVNPYSCSYCGRVFYYKSPFIRHLKTHEIT